MHKYPQRKQNANIVLTLKRARGRHYNQNMTKLDGQRIPMLFLLEFMSKPEGEFWHNKFVYLSR
jgi:hypothetical protein